MFLTKEPDADGWYLECHDPEKDLVFLPLHGEAIELNRTILQTPHISRKHAVLTWNSELKNWSIYDMGSLNGTYVNMVDIERKVQRELKENDIISLGVNSEDLTIIPHFKIKHKVKNVLETMKETILQQLRMFIPNQQFSFTLNAGPDQKLEVTCGEKQSLSTAVTTSSADKATVQDSKLNIKELVYPTKKETVSSDEDGPPDKPQCSWKRNPKIQAEVTNVNRKPSVGHYSGLESAAEKSSSSHNRKPEIVKEERTPNVAIRKQPSVTRSSSVDSSSEDIVDLSDSSSERKPEIVKKERTSKLVIHDKTKSRRKQSVTKSSSVDSSSNDSVDSSNLSARNRATTSGRHGTNKTELRKQASGKPKLKGEMHKKIKFHDKRENESEDGSEKGATRCSNVGMSSGYSSTDDSVQSSELSSFPKIISMTSGFHVKKIQKARKSISNECERKVEMSQQQNLHHLQKAQKARKTFPGKCDSKVDSLQQQSSHRKMENKYKEFEKQKVKHSFRSSVDSNTDDSAELVYHKQSVPKTSKSHVHKDKQTMSTEQHMLHQRNTHAHISEPPLVEAYAKKIAKGGSIARSSSKDSYTDDSLRKSELSDISKNAAKASRMHVSKVHQVKKSATGQQDENSELQAVQQYLHKKKRISELKLLKRYRIKPCFVRLERCDQPGFRIDSNLSVPWKRRRVKSCKTAFENYRKHLKQRGKRKLRVESTSSEFSDEDEPEGESSSNQESPSEDEPEGDLAFIHKTHDELHHIKRNKKKQLESEEENNLSSGSNIKRSEKAESVKRLSMQSKHNMKESVCADVTGTKIKVKGQCLGRSVNKHHTSKNEARSTLRDDLSSSGCEGGSSEAPPLAWGNHASENKSKGTISKPIKLKKFQSNDSAEEIVSSSTKEKKKTIIGTELFHSDKYSNKANRPNVSLVKERNTSATSSESEGSDEKMKKVRKYLGRSVNKHHTSKNELCSSSKDDFSSSACKGESSKALPFAHGNLVSENNSKDMFYKPIKIKKCRSTDNADESSSPTTKKKKKIFLAAEQFHSDKYSRKAKVSSVEERRTSVTSSESEGSDEMTSDSHSGRLVSNNTLLSSLSNEQQLSHKRKTMDKQPSVKGKEEERKKISQNRPRKSIEEQNPVSRSSLNPNTNAVKVDSASERKIENRVHHNKKIRSARFEVENEENMSNGSEADSLPAARSNSCKSNLPMGGPSKPEAITSDTKVHTWLKSLSSESIPSRKRSLSSSSEKEESTSYFKQKTKETLPEQQTPANNNRSELGRALSEMKPQQSLENVKNNRPTTDNIPRDIRTAEIKPFMAVVKVEPSSCSEPQDIKPDISKIKIEKDEDFVFYSQEEEVILISSSDDEEQNDCSFIQEIPIMPLVPKKEPVFIDLVEEDEEGNDDEDEDDSIGEELGSSVYDDTSDFFPELSQSLIDEIDFEERQEELKKLHQVEKPTGPQNTFLDVDMHEPSTSSGFYSSKFTAKKKNLDDIAMADGDNEEFFPQLSQAILDEIADEERRERLSELSNRVNNKRPRIANMTEPQPLPQRPSHNFGKGVIQRGNSNDNVWLKPNPPQRERKMSQASTARKKSSPQEGGKGNAKSKLLKFKNQLQSKGVRIPGGGSDIRKSVSEFKIPKISKDPPVKSNNVASTFKAPFPPVPPHSKPDDLKRQSLPSTSGEPPNRKKSVFEKQKSSRMDHFIEEFKKLPSAKANVSSVVKKPAPTSSTSTQRNTVDRAPGNIFAKPISKVLPNTGHTFTPAPAPTPAPQAPTPALRPPALAPLAPVRTKEQRHVRFNFPESTAVARPPVNCIPQRPHVSQSSHNSLNTNLHRESAVNLRYLHDTAVRQIVSWSRKWLDEQDGKKLSPPVANPYIKKKVTYTYNSVEEYFLTYFPLLLFEMWSSLFSSYKAVTDDPKFQINVESSRIVGNDLIEMQCKTRVQTSDLLPNQSSMLLTEGTVLEVRYSRVKEASRAVNLGYVFFVRQEPFPDPKYKIQKFGMYVRRTNYNFDLSRPVILRKIGNLRSYVRQAESLKYLSRSEMCSSILDPEKAIKVIKVDPRTKLKVQSTFNSCQRNCILRTSTAVYIGNEEPHVVLIHGPPGTGKTHLITGIIQQLLYGKPDGLACRILVVAPSNAAVDEIGCRLILLRNHCKERKIHAPNFIRLGQQHMMHPNVKPYSNDNLMNRHKMERDRKRREIVNDAEKLAVLENNLALELRLLRSQQECPVDVLKRKLDELHYVQQQKSDLEFRSEAIGKEICNFRTMRRHYVEKADIILSTLNSCRQAIPERLNFTCCIVDEATQCSEPELLSPILAFDIRKLILVGDPQQLPATVKSVEASEQNYQLSMFERMLYKANMNKESVLMLTEQYRMHKEICCFPSKEFYNNALVTKCIKDFPLKPYVLFDLKDSQETSDPNSSSISNNREADFVASLACEIFRVTNGKHSIGIITPYRDQVKQISTKLGSFSNIIEVNTVDGFQGREKHIILLSCVRSSFTGNIGFLNNRQRLNVAITRASHCLIICGNLHSLSVKDPTWQRLIEDAYLRSAIHTTTTSNSVNLLVKNLLINSR